MIEGPFILFLVNNVNIYLLKLVRHIIYLEKRIHMNISAVTAL